jgi:hypothetical protein
MFFCSEANAAYYPMGIRVSFPGLNRPERKVNHSRPSSAEIYNTLQKGQKAEQNSVKTQRNVTLQGEMK